MIEFDRFTFCYPDAAAPTLADLDLQVPEGDFALVVGLTGSGKSTLLRSVNGLVPWFSGGTAVGDVVVAGRSPRRCPPRELASVVGFVGQDPLAGFVTDTVEEELAYGMEQLAVPPPVMRRRVEEVLDLLGIAALRRRPLRTLSGGEQQRVAIASVLTANPRVLLLDEPTSALDPAAAEEALAAVLRLVHDVGVTVLAAEHRLERVLEYADRLVVLDGASGRAGAPADLIGSAPLQPPVVSLGLVCGWDPLPLSVRDARRRAAGLRAELAGAAPPAPPESGAPAPPPGDPRDGLVAEGVTVTYGRQVAVREADLSAAPGEVVALMGRNGSGKTSLLWAASGAGRRTAGRIRIAGQEVAAGRRGGPPASVVLVPQQPTDLLFSDSVDAECALSDEMASTRPGATRSLFDRITGVPVGGRVHPRDLSDGQRLALALAVQLATQPRVVLLDEPTRGLDYRAKDRLTTILTELAAEGRAVVVATHDVEFVARTASRVVVLAAGEAITSAPVADALAASPVFAPQVAKVLAPERWLTVEQVTAGLRRAKCRR